MKIAALYDIHGNLPALNAVLAELEEVQPDIILVGGDTLFGPMPSQALERLSQFGDRVQAIRGNADREAIDAFDDNLPALDFPGPILDCIRWSGKQLSRSQRDYLAQLPEQITLHIENLGDILFCHATPRNDEEVFTPLTPQRYVDIMFEDVKQQIVVCGHTHMQYERKSGDVRIIVAGSVGMAYADQPGAYWLLLSPQGAEWRRTGYDFEDAARQIRATGYPQAEDYAATNVLTVPSPAYVSEIFEKRRVTKE